MCVRMELVKLRVRKGESEMKSFRGGRWNLATALVDELFNLMLGSVTYTPGGGPNKNLSNN